MNGDKRRDDLAGSGSKGLRGGSTMKRGNRWAIAVLALVGALGLSACGGSSETASESSPYTLEEASGSEHSRITLTPKAAERLEIRTASVRSGAGTKTVIPYSAVLYEPDGKTWTYVSPKPLTFVRHAIVVDRIDGNHAVLSSGPALGTKVATVGVAELYGAESGIDGGGGH
jgi:hypothetical protein